MDRRKMLMSAGAVAMAGAVSGVAVGQQTKTQLKANANERRSTLTPKFERCLEACQTCESTCNQTVSYCMTHLSKGHKDHATCAAIAMSCQEFCSLATQILGRSCDLAPVSCAACAKACDACAAECEKMKDDAQMTACAKACRECATICRSMV